MIAIAAAVFAAAALVALEAAGSPSADSPAGAHWLAAPASLILVWFLPGFAILEATVGMRERLRVVERVVLSVPVSLALVALLGVALNAAGVEIGGRSVAAGAAAIVWLASLGSLVRVVLGTQPIVRPLRGARLSPRWAISLGVLVVAMAGSLSVLALKAPPASGRFTELALTDLRGVAPPMPIRVERGEIVQLELHVRSREATASSYTLRVEGPDGRSVSEPNLFLEPGDEARVALRAWWSSGRAGSLSIHLDRGAERSYRELRLAVDVGP